MAGVRQVSDGTESPDQPRRTERNSLGKSGSAKKAKIPGDLNGGRVDETEESVTMQSNEVRKIQNRRSEVVSVLKIKPACF